MQYDVVALGELLIDFTGSGVSPQGNPVYEANPGGAPGNVLAMLAKLGKRTAILGKVGDDIFGRQLRAVTEKAGIDTTGLLMDADVNTTLAIVHNHSDGDREFSFFRNPGADTRLAADELNTEILENTGIFHFGTLSLTHEPARSATQRAVEIARASGARISFDPNLRTRLWADLNDAKRQMEWGCRQCDILKIAEEELEFLTGVPEIPAGLEALRKLYPNIRVIFVTCGSRGAQAFWGDIHVEVPAFLNANTIDTTGAGDTFCGCCLSRLLKLELSAPDEKELQDMVRFANAAASLVTTRKGALLSMPDKRDVLALLAEQ